MDWMCGRTACLHPDEWNSTPEIFFLETGGHKCDVGDPFSSRFTRNSISPGLVPQSKI